MVNKRMKTMKSETIFCCFKRLFDNRLLIFNLVIYPFIIMLTFKSNQFSIVNGYIIFVSSQSNYLFWLVG